MRNIKKLITNNVDYELGKENDGELITEINAFIDQFGYGYEIMSYSRLMKVVYELEEEGIIIEFQEDGEAQQIGEYKIVEPLKPYKGIKTDKLSYAIGDTINGLTICSVEEYEDSFLEHPVYKCFDAEHQVVVSVANSKNVCTFEKDNVFIIDGHKYIMAEDELCELFS